MVRYEASTPQKQPAANVAFSIEAFYLKLGTLETMTFLTNILGSIDGTATLSLAIIICALFLEDLTTIVVGVLASDGLIATPLAFISLLSGVVLGDMAIYALGSLARKHKKIAEFIDHDSLAPFRAWLDEHFRKTIFLGHFIPGLRLSSYSASGFFRKPFPTFISTSIPSAIILISTLFTISYWFGSVTSKWVSHARWGIAAVVIVALFFLGRHNVAMYRKKQNELSETPTE